MKVVIAILLTLIVLILAPWMLPVALGFVGYYLEQILALIAIVIVVKIAAKVYKSRKAKRAGQQ